MWHMCTNRRSKISSNNGCFTSLATYMPGGGEDGGDEAGWCAIGYGNKGRLVGRLAGEQIIDRDAQGARKRDYDCD